MGFEKWYDKNYKKMLFFSITLVVLAFGYLVFFYIQNDDIIYKDVSLSGGTTYTVETDFLARELERELSEDFNDFSVRGVSDGAGNQIQVIVTVNEENSERMELALEEILGFELTDRNSSIEFTDSGLSGNFFNQLIIAVVLAFFWMAAVVFMIFSKGLKLKFLVLFGNLLFAIYLGNFIFRINFFVSIFIFILFSIVFMWTYIKYSIPSFAVMLSAFSNIVFALAVVNLVGMRLSTAGVISFLMLIGYSVDTDILLVSRVLNNKKYSVNSLLFGAFKTGMKMTMTSIIAIATALIIVYSFESVLNQIFSILLIGLSFDLLTTWITNASILKWYAEIRDG